VERLEHDEVGAGLGEKADLLVERGFDGGGVERGESGAAGGTGAAGSGDEDGGAGFAAKVFVSITSAPAAT
jgi:hypothetical protein